MVERKVAESSSIHLVETDRLNSEEERLNSVDNLRRHVYIGEIELQDCSDGVHFEVHTQQGSSWRGVSRR
jgi:hypothetical protein